MLAAARPARPGARARQAREAADEILSRPEYQWDDERTLLERVGEWIADQLGDLLGPLGIGGAAGVGRWLVLFALVGLVAWLIYRSRAGWGAGRPGRGRDGGRVVVARRGRPSTGRRGRRAEAEGRWRDALRARYRVLVGELAARGSSPTWWAAPPASWWPTCADRPRRGRARLRGGHRPVRGGLVRRRAGGPGRGRDRLRGPGRPGAPAHEPREDAVSGR